MAEGAGGMEASVQTESLTKNGATAAPRLTAGLKTTSQTLQIRTERGPQFIDITAHVEDAIQQAGLQNGFALVFSKHTTAAIRINEAEPHLIRDMEEMLEKVIPAAHDYGHNRHAHAVSVDGELPNGHSHCQHLLLGASEAVPVVDGQLMIGRWQRVFLVELDHARDREVLINLIGE